MDKLHYIVQHLDNEDFSSLEIFLQRNRYRKDRKDSELLNLLRKHESLPQKAALKKLYKGKDEVVAYHALRKRLLSTVLDFFTLKSIDERKGYHQYSSEGLLNLANFFFREGASSEGLIYLKKVIQQEENNPNAEYLNKAYLSWIENWYSIDCEESFEDILNAFNQSEQAFQNWNRLKILTSSVQRNIYQSKVIGLELDVYNIIKQVAKEFDLKKNYLNSVEGVWLVAKNIDYNDLGQTELEELYKWLFGRCKKKITPDEIEPTSASRLLEIYLVLGEIALKVGKTKAITFIHKQSEELLPQVTKVEAESFKVKWLMQEWLYHLNFERDALESFSEIVLKKISEDDLTFTIPRVLFCWIKAQSIGVKAFIENGKHSPSWYLSRIPEEERVLFLLSYFAASKGIVRSSILGNRIMKWSDSYLSESNAKAFQKYFTKFKQDANFDNSEFKKVFEPMLSESWKAALDILVE